MTSMGIIDGVGAGTGAAHEPVAGMVDPLPAPAPVPSARPVDE